MSYIPHTEDDVRDMLAAIGAKSIEDLFDEIPAGLKIEELEGNAAAALRRCEEIREIAPETPGYDECLSRNRARPGGSGSASR